jgi:hypothetical protein
MVRTWVIAFACWRKAASYRLASLIRKQDISDTYDLRRAAELWWRGLNPNGVAFYSPGQSPGTLGRRIASPEGARQATEGVALSGL